MPVRILLVENDPIHSRLIQIYLSESEDTKFSVLEARTITEAIAVLVSEQIDAVVLNLDLPDSQAISSMTAIKDAVKDAPVFILANTLEDDLAREAVRQGAYDILYYDQLTGPQLCQTVIHAVSAYRAVGSVLPQDLSKYFFKCSNNALIFFKYVNSGAVSKWKIEQANINCHSLLSSGVAVVEGEMLHDVVSPALFNELNDILTRTKEEGECRGEIFSYKSDGEEFWLQFDGVCGAGGIAVILTNMTPLKRRELDLDNSRAAAQKLLDEKTAILGAMCEMLPVALNRLHDNLDELLDGHVSPVPESFRSALGNAKAEVASLKNEVDGFVRQGPSAGFAYIGTNYLTVLEMSPDLSAVVSAKDGQIKFMNRIGRQILGFNDKTDVGSISFLSLVPDDYSVLFEDSMMALRIESARVPMHLKSSDNRLVDVELQVVDCPAVGLDEWKGEDLVLISAADTTRRNRASRRIIAREEQLRKIMDNVADAIVVVDQDGVIETVNRSTETIFGIASSELVGGGVGRLLGPARDEQGRSAEGLETFLSGGSTSRISGWRRHMGRRSNHELFPIEIAVRDLNLGERHLYIGLIRDISERVAYEENIMYMATHDMLTALANRSNFHDELRVVLERANNDKSRFGLMFFDLDHFKSINNSYGHLVGDKVLTMFAKRVQRVLGDRARIVARLSADEFVALIENCGGDQELVVLAQSVSEAVQRPIIVDHHDIRISCCVGIAEYPGAGPSSEELIRSAEYAVRHAKGIGRGAVQVYDETLSNKLLFQQKLETALSTALETHQFQLYYQPKIDLETNLIMGAEALLRWFHPEIGLVSPSDFIPIAEETGQIRDIGAWVLNQVCVDLVRMFHSDLNRVPIAVNLSAVQFRDGNLATLLRDIMQKHSIPANLLEMELTESALVEDVDKAVETLQRINELGLSIAIDDFGSGYSSFGYLTRFPIDCLKIDRTFIRDIPFSKDDMTVTRAIVGMAKNLSLKIVAEGVETVEQAAFLKEHGCDIAQGYLYSRPVPYEAFTRLLQTSVLPS